MIRAVFFDVDFTLIYPGPTFQGSGYREFCARYGVTVDPDAFDRAVARASSLLDSQGGIYDPEVFVGYTRRIIEAMGGCGPGVDAAARDIYAEWAGCHHFSLYDDVADAQRPGLHQHRGDRASTSLKFGFDDGALLQPDEFDDNHSRQPDLLQ